MEKRHFLLPLLSLLLLTLVAYPALCNEDSAFGYTGAKKCKLCHNKESTGSQYKIWQASRHSRAYETLSTPKAAEFAAERGIKGSPQEAPECLKCHATAFGLTEEELAASKITLEEGVGCESCHGPASGYASRTTMKKLYEGEMDPATVGLTVKPDESVCVKCHNTKSPAYKEFHYDEFVSRINHAIPK